MNKNASLDVIEKFYFLKSALHGQAKDIINSLELTVPNYDVAITLLCQRYKNRRAIIQRHIKLLFEEPQKVNKESSIAIKALLDSTM